MHLVKEVWLLSDIQSLYSCCNYTPKNKIDDNQLNSFDNLYF